MNIDPTGLADLSEGHLEGLCAWGILRALGFESMDIYFGVGEVGGMEGVTFPRGLREGQPVPLDCPQMIVKIVAQDLEFVINYADPDLSKEGFEEVWMKSIVMWNGATTIERRALIRDSWMHEHHVGLIVALIGKGFRFPSCDSDLDAVLAYLLTEWEA